jgi:hypothetical protein
MSMIAAEFDEHSRPARLARRRDRLIAAVVEATAALRHVATLNRPSRRIDARIARLHERLGDFATDLEFDRMERERERQ